MSPYGMCLLWLRQCQPRASPPQASVFLKKMLQMPNGGASTFIQIPTVGPQEEGKYPTHGTGLKFYLMIVSKNIFMRVVFSGFSHGF